MPSATTFLERFSCLVRPKLSWVYVPLPPGDDIIAMGFGGYGRFIMIRKRLTGDILIGRALGHRPHHCALLELSPLAFVFNQIPVRLVNGFGVVVQNDSSSDNVIRVLAPGSRTQPPRRAIGEILHSVAPLGGLVRVSIYQSQDSGFCAGLLIEYEDGAQRTLGSCRLGVDPVTTYGVVSEQDIVEPKPYHSQQYIE
ncbi:hypothetical protein CEP53_001678 [Fusarium sp. AF-6]|nr:hypothetical protein CEP53_001678 [Fusarium sp. AF-6]